MPTRLVVFWAGITTLCVDYVSGRNHYMGYLISLGIYSFKGVKVGLDCANGSSWNIAKSVFDALGADTYVINAQPNGLNINNNAGSTHIEGLQKFVVEKGLDIGFAYDGDADRCLCVDEKGNVVTGDHILYIYGCYMKERGKLADPLTIYPQVLENVRVTDEKAAQADEAVQEAVNNKVAEALGDTGRILVRESGTEPVARVMVEAPDHDTCQKYVSQVVDTIKSRGYGV